jgi:hypothetical protein
MSVLRVMMCMGYFISQIEIFSKGSLLLFNEPFDLPHHSGQVPPQGFLKVRKG